MRIFVAVTALFMLSGCAVSESMMSADYWDGKLRDTLHFETPGKAVALSYARGADAKAAMRCSRDMRPYAALKLRPGSVGLQEQTIAIGKRRGDIAAELSLGENGYGTSYVSLGTAKRYRGETAIVQYHLEF